MQRSKYRRILSTVFMSACLVWSVPETHAAEKVTSAIGVEILRAGQAEVARSGQTLSPDDQLRVLVNPRSKLYVYVVHNDGSTATLIYDSRLRISHTLISVPREDGRFRFDGKSNRERLTVIASPVRVPALEPLTRGPIPNAQWQETETELKTTSKLPLTFRSSPKPVMLAGGNLRNIELSTSPSAKNKAVRNYSGLGMIVKRYEFRVRSR